ncbi:DUF1127 domain-containing protein [Tropicimonas marinistellae]|uniref:DUF1127 domain-containing protein n=1 Tax=Tropicimonas marinistellae TaxID=1739787 RepID=UPI00082B8AE6|nr:DUF1127 domain-containing protein [Tropicimonas marinistellae]
MSTHTTNAPVFGALRPEGFVRQLIAMVALHKQRRDLARLDDRALRDIGISRYEASVEANRSVWDVPQHWLR